MRSICKKCIHNYRGECEAFNDDYMNIFSKNECEDFDEGFCPTIPVESANGEDEYTSEWG